MLSEVIDLVAERGWFDVSLPFEKSIHFTRGACLWILLSRNGVPHTHVKFSDCYALAEEARRAEAASACYPSFAPAYVGYARHNALEVLVTRAVEATTLQPSDVVALQPAFIRYFSAMTRAPRPPGALENDQLLGALKDYYRDHHLSALAGRWLESDAAALAARMPTFPQHGDLVLNNLALARKHGLVIFDWEDFGAVGLPGLDLFTLEMSWLGSDALARDAAERPFTRLVTEALGSTSQRYQQLLPVYALAFRFLKRNYGAEVRDRMDRQLVALADTLAA